MQEVLYLPFLFFSLFKLIINGKNFQVFSLSFITLEIISGLIFYCYQTRVERPQIVETDIFSNLIQLTYSLDKPYNCFPSLHVSVTTLITYYWLKEDFFTNHKSHKYLLIFFGFTVKIVGENPHST